jgi:hypothetical protein
MEESAMANRSKIHGEVPCKACSIYEKCPHVQNGHIMGGPPRETGPIDEKFCPFRYQQIMDGPPREDVDSSWFKKKSKKLRRKV